MSDSKYVDTLADNLLQYGVLVSEFKKIYPMYKSNPNDPEAKSLYLNNQSQLNKVFSNLEDLNNSVSNNNALMADELSALSDVLKESKQYYNANQPTLQNVIDNNRGDFPREHAFKQRLIHQYVETGYTVALIIGLVFFYRKLLF